VKLAIFDLDDTLIDFAATRRMAYDRIAAVLRDAGIDAAAYLQACPAVDRALFAQFEQGRLSRADYRARRFADPFAALGLAAPPGLVQQLNTLFMDCVNDEPLLHADATARPTASAASCAPPAWTRRSTTWPSARRSASASPMLPPSTR
jgi:putative hydrolase of the HAD superfamily